MSNLGERIQNLRKLKRLSQAELAHLMDVHEMDIHSWESGKTDVSAMQLNRLCSILEVRPEFILESNLYEVDPDNLRQLDTQTAVGLRALPTAQRVALAYLVNVLSGRKLDLPTSAIRQFHRQLSPLDASQLALDLLRQVIAHRQGEPQIAELAESGCEIIEKLHTVIRKNPNENKKQEGSPMD